MEKSLNIFSPIRDGGNYNIELTNWGQKFRYLNDFDGSPIGSMIIKPSNINVFVQRIERLGIKPIFVR